MALDRRLWAYGVWMRDGFTCRRCGQMAPGVVLDVLEAVTDPCPDASLPRYLTVCVACRPEFMDAFVSIGRFSDDGDLHDEQFKMLLGWLRSPRTVDPSGVSRVLAYWRLISFQQTPNESHARRLESLVARFGPADVLDACREARKYFRRRADGALDGRSVQRGLSKVGGIAYVSSAAQEQPHLKDLFLIRGILRQRFGQKKPALVMGLMEDAIAAGGSVEDLREFARSERTFSRWCRTVEGYTAKLNLLRSEEAKNEEVASIRWNLCPELSHGARFTFA